MDNERLRWITPPPTLDMLRLSLRYSAVPEGTLVHVHASGHCDRKRGTLWTLNEAELAGKARYDATDLVHHIALACVQSRPVTEASLQRALTGGYWEQPELPF